jgi:hypothetical protein
MKARTSGVQNLHARTPRQHPRDTGRGGTDHRVSDVQIRKFFVFEGDSKSATVAVLNALATLTEGLENHQRKLTMTMLWLVLILIRATQPSTRFASFATTLLRSMSVVGAI